MPESPGLQRLIAPESGRLRQGEIIAGLELFALTRPYAPKENAQLVQRPEAPFCIVLTQDCDLQQSHFAYTGENHPDSGKPVKSHNRLWSVLVAPGWDEDDVTTYRYLRGDVHKDLETMPKMTSLESSYLTSNRIDRFHWVGTGDHGPACNVAFDFKLASGLTPEYIEAALKDGQAQRIGRLGEPWVQDLAHRYISYLGRVALPVDDEQ